MRLQNTFVQGKLNRDIDERLLPKGQYPYAENIRVANSEGSDVGAIENPLGNEKLTNLGLTNGVTIGAFSDDSNQKLYWFVTSDTKDLVLEYDYVNETDYVILETPKPNSVLNFSTSYLITGVVKIINGDSDKDLLVWTDDLNQPRMINIKRFKDYFIGNPAYVVEEDEILLIKQPPKYAPVVTLRNTDTENEDNLRDKFLSFSYRYVYQDGERSALSSFSNYAFDPNLFKLDFNTMENVGMTNRFNSVRIGINTGSSRVVEIEVVSKESNSNKLSIIERFNKAELGLGNNALYEFDFTNKKVYSALPEDELFRLYDAVPLKAKALELIGTRLVFGNYVEGYNLVDNTNTPITLKDTVVSVVSTEFNDVELGVSFSTNTVVNDRLTLPFAGEDFSKNKELSFDIHLSRVGTGDTFSGFFTYNIPTTLNTTVEGTEPNTLGDFPNFALDFLNQLTVFFRDSIVLPPFSKFKEVYIIGDDLPNPFFVDSFDNESVVIGTPVYIYETYTDGTFTTLDSTTVTQWSFNNVDTKVTLSNDVQPSLKTERGYEVGIVYLDKFNRASTPQTWLNNNVFIKQSLADKSNKLKIDIDPEQKAPYWADRFKIVVKQSKGTYETIYSNFAYSEEDYVWVLLEGSNINKVKEGDEIILKSIDGRFIEEVSKSTVLSVEAKESNFITGNFSTSEQIFEIKERAGVYFKIKADSLDTALKDSSTFYKNVSGRTKNTTKFARCWVDLFSYDDGGTIVPLELTTGTRVNIKINSVFNYDAGASFHKFEEEYILTKDYASFEDWFNEEVTTMYTSSTDDDTIENYKPKVTVLAGSAVNTQNDFWYNLTYNENKVENNGKLYLQVEGFETGGSRGRSGYVDAAVSIIKSGGTLIFETVPTEIDADIFYETEETFDIVDNLHVGNVAKVLPTDPVTILLNFHNCYSFGNGVESFKYKDSFNTKYLNIDLRPTTTSIEKYKEVRRYADLTYSETYNENNNLNGLNEFNLSKANYKEDIDKKYGYIQKLYSRDTDLVVFQEDKVSKVLYGKDLLMNADGTSNISSIENVLGQQITFGGEYGISRNPESFDFNGYSVYFTDAKRGAVLRLGNNGIEEISKNGMTGYFRDAYKNNIYSVKLGGYDPYHDQYVLSVKNDTPFTLTYDEGVQGFTSFHSFIPEFMVGMNNSFYSFKNGELYIHNSSAVNRNTYYGVFYPSKVSVIINDSPSDVKELKAVSLEGNNPWEITLKAYISNVDDFTQSTIKDTEFVKKEGIWYAHARRNENVNQEDSKSLYGIGTVLTVDGNTITVNGYNDTLVVGDMLLKINTMDAIGEITNSSYNPITKVTTITLDDSTGLVIGNFVGGRKDARIEGGNLRGYSLRADLETDKTTKVELFAVNTEVVKSYM